MTKRKTPQKYPWGAWLALARRGLLLTAAIIMLVRIAIFVKRREYLGLFLSGLGFHGMGSGPCLGQCLQVLVLFRLYSTVRADSTKKGKKLLDRELNPGLHGDSVGY